VIRAVLDTTVAVAAGKSSSTSSPNREIIARWLPPLLRTPASGLLCAFSAGCLGRCEVIRDS
jgi:hypothetical protein